MNTLRLLGILSVLWPAFIAAKDEKEIPPLKLSIQYSDGLSSRSSPSQPPRIILFKEHTHIHLLISNASDRDIILWRPYCPPGDAAIIFEFKDSEASTEIMRARISMDYTAGMGFPKTLTLVPKDTLVVNADFLHFWDFPIKVDRGQERTMLVRAVYDSKADKSQSFDPKAKDVWIGKVETAWEKVFISNRTDPDNP